MEHPNLAEVSSLFSTGVMLTLLVGYARALIQSRHDVVFHLVASITLVYVAYTLRTNYWDFPWFDGLKDRYFLRMNFLFNALALWGGIHGHTAMHRMIPLEDRDKWSLWIAWLYPPFTVFGFVRRFLRWVQSLRS